MSDNSNIFDELIAASKINQSRLLRDLMPQIEKAIDAGVSMEKIHAKLMDVGLQYNFATFRNIFYRVRKKSKKVPNQPPQQKVLSKEDRIKLKEKMARDSALAKPKTLNWDPHKKIDF